jgi:predicted RNase H-like HicB family nuclease
MSRFLQYKTAAMARKEIVTTRRYTFTAIFEPAEEGGYTVHFPALPGCITEGDTLEEARAMAADALELYLEVLRQEGRPIPPEEPQDSVEPFRERVSITLKTA